MSVEIEKLKFLKRPKFLRQRPIMLITDQPLDLEIKSGIPYSAQSAANMFGELGKVGAVRGQIHATYLFNCRLDKGDVGAIFHQTGLPISEYRFWPQSKKDSILNFAYNELETLRDEISEVQPSLIICAGRWALYFLTGETTVNETKKSPFGTLLKWRSSHLKLGDFWNYDKPHVVLPILPSSSAWQLPEKATVLRQDFVRAGILGKAAIAGNIEEYTERKYDFVVRPTFAQVRDFFLNQFWRLENSDSPIDYGIDVETRDGYHDCIGIADSESSGICIPFATVGNPHYWTEGEELEIVNMLRSFLLHPKVAHIGQNYWYDMQYMWRDLLVVCAPTDDTMVMQHTMFPGLEKSLDFLASLYAKIYKYWKDEGATHKGRSDEERWYYNIKDCCYTLECCRTLRKMYSLAPANIRNAYSFQKDKTLPVLVKLMKRGVRTRISEKNRLYAELTKVMEEIQAELNYIVGEDFNPKSADQKKALFYDLFGLPKQLDPKTKAVTLNAEALETLKEKNPIIKPIADRIAEYGNLATFSSTFLGAKLDIDGRMRCSYNLCGTDTFRLSSSQNAFGSGLNLQNIPKGGKTASGRVLPNIRSLFIPDPGYTFFDIDLDSADLRIVVARSGASDLQYMLDNNMKPYIELMKEYYNDPTKNKYSDEYRIFKGFAHGTHYLGSAAGLAVRLGLLVHEVEKLQKWYLGRNPEIALWHKELKAQVMKRGWIENIFGYRKYFFNKQEPTLFQIAAAWEPQSTVGLLINRGMVAIDEKEPEIETLLQVHDSLAGQFPTAKPWLIDRIKELCEIELPYETPITIPVGVATSEISWGECG